jgi:hypothetical protein
MKGIHFVLSCAIAFSLVAGPAAASRRYIDVNQSAQAIIEQQQRIREEVTTERNGWDEIPAMKRSAVLRDQDEVFMLLEGKQTIADLNPDQQVKVANLLESINAAVTGAEDQRKICTRERKVGSNFTQRVCRTAGEIRAEREATRTGLERGGNLRKMVQDEPGGVR